MHSIELVDLSVTSNAPVNRKVSNAINDHVVLASTNFLIVNAIQKMWGV